MVTCVGSLRSFASCPSSYISTLPESGPYKQLYRDEGTGNFFLSHNKIRTRQRGSWPVPSGTEKYRPIEGLQDLRNVISWLFPANSNASVRRLLL